MTLAEYLEATGLDEEAVAERLGKNVHAVKTWRNRELPKTWARQLGLEPELEEPSGRDSEQTPKPPPDARVVESPVEGVDFSAIAGYIEGAYRLGAHVLADTNPALAGAIDSHAKPAGDAWAKWVESEPKVAALLQRMMVGTPLGEVIAVHVSLAFAFFLARSAELRARAEAEPVAGEPGDDGRRFEPEPALA